MIDNYRQYFIIIFNQTVFKVAYLSNQTTKYNLKCFHLFNNINIFQLFLFNGIDYSPLYIYKNSAIFSHMSSSQNKELQILPPKQATIQSPFLPQQDKISVENSTYKAKINPINIQLEERSQYGNQSNLPKTILVTRQRYKSSFHSIMIGLTISLSAVNFGYGLCAMSVVDMSQIMQIYGIGITEPETHALLIGLMPIGGIFGAALNQLFLKYFNRKHSIYIMLAILWLGLGLMLIQTPATIGVGRFIEGVSIGLYVSVSPIFLKEVTAKEMRSVVMTMFGLGKAFGVVVAYSLQNIFLAAGWVSTSYIVLITFNGYIAIIQAVLYFFFIPQSPLELVEKQKIEEAKRQILTIYHEEYLEDVLTQLQNECQTAKAQAIKADTPDAKEGTSIEYQRKKKQLMKAFLMGTHVILLRQFIGANCVTTFVGQIIYAFNQAISVYMALILNCIQFIFNLLAVLFITKRFGRRPVLIFGTGLMGVFSLGIAISLFYNVQVPILLFFSIYMALNGACILTMGWSYPSEVLSPDVTMIPNILGWIGLSIVTSVPPLIVGIMPENNAYPLFFFFGGYGIFAVIILFIYMKQTKGLTYDQIIESF